MWREEVYVEGVGVCGGSRCHVTAGMKYGAKESVKASQLHEATARASQRSCAA